MPNLDQITICGHLGKDAEMKETSAGHVTEFSVAVGYGKKDNRKTTWYSVNCWHGVAKGCQNLRKGEAVICIGSMRCDEWTTDNGDKRRTWKLQAHSVGKSLYVKEEKREPEPPDESHTDPGEVPDDDDIPF